MEEIIIVLVLMQSYYRSWIEMQVILSFIKHPIQLPTLFPLWALFGTCDMYS